MLLCSTLKSQLGIRVESFYRPVVDWAFFVQLRVGGVSISSSTNACNNVAQSLCGISIKIRLYLIQNGVIQISAMNAAGYVCSAEQSKVLLKTFVLIVSLVSRLSLSLSTCHA